jgi:hypothetical protein
MDLIMNGLLLTATLFAGIYCWVLSGRVRALKSLDSGLGGAIVTLTRQIELARGTLEEARSAARDGRADLSQLVARGDATAAQLRVLLAALKDHEPTATADPAPATAGSVQETPVLPRVEASAVQEEAASRPAGPMLPRLVVPAPVEPAPAAPAPAEPAWAQHGSPEPARPAIASVPKPRLAIPLENILRSRAPLEPVEHKSESELLDALNAIASGDR